MTTAPTRKDSIKVGISEPRPTHDISLTDNKGNQVGLILTNRLGVRDPKGILEGNMPRTALRTSQGNVGYDDLELPFTAEVQNTMVGGRAQEEFARDRTKYSDAFRMDTTKEFPICGPLEEEQYNIYASVVDFDSNPLTVPGQYISNDTAYQSQEYYRVYFAAEAFITGVDLVIDLPYDSTTIYYGPATVDGDHVTMEYSLYIPRKTSWSGAMPKDKYLAYRSIHLPFSAHVAAGGYLNFSIATNKYAWLYLDFNATNCEMKRYVDTAWITPTDDGYGNVMDNHTLWARYYIVANTEHKTMIFEYKRQMYMIQNMSDGTSAPLLYMNGYRGLATDNSDNKTKIYTGLTLTENELYGKIALIIDGPGENELQPWRRIISNTTNGICTVAPAWKVTHTANTTYVILDTNKWTVIGSHGLTKPVTDVAVVNDMVIFCQGAAAKIRYMKEAIDNAAWTRTFKEDPTYYADRLEPIVDEEGELYLWRAVADGAKVDRSKIYPYTYYNTLVFDINKKLRDELELNITRAESDKARELAKDDNLIPDEIYLIRQFDDLTTEHKRILTDYATETDKDKKADLADRDEDIWTIKEEIGWL